MVLRVRESISPQLPLQKETKTIHRFCYVVFLRQSCKFYCLRWISTAIVIENPCKNIAKTYVMYTACLNTTIIWHVYVVYIYISRLGWIWDLALKLFGTWVLWAFIALGKRCRLMAGLGLPLRHVASCVRQFKSWVKQGEVLQLQVTSCMWDANWSDWQSFAAKSRYAGQRSCHGDPPWAAPSSPLSWNTLKRRTKVE